MDDVFSQGLGGYVPSWSPAPVRAIDAPTPGARIAHHIMTSKEAANQQINAWNDRANIPAYVQQIKDAQDAHDASMRAIDRAMAKLSAAPPEMPTTPDFSLGETAAIGIGSLFGGGLRAIAPISGQVGQMAQYRQRTAFENAMRRFSVGQDAGRLEYERALRDSEHYRDSAEGWQRAGAEDAARLQNDARNLQAQTLGWTHGDEADARNFDQQQRLAATADQRQSARDQANREHDRAMLRLRNFIDVENDTRTESRAMKQHLIDSAQNADSGDAVDAAISQFRTSGGRIDDQTYQMLRAAAERRAQMSDMRLQNQTYSAYRPSNAVHTDPVTGAPIPMQGGTPHLPAVADGMIPVMPDFRGTGGVSVAPVATPKQAAVPGKTTWDSMLYKPQVEIVGKLRAAIQQKEALRNQFGDGALPPSDPRNSEREKAKNDIDGKIRELREELELKLTPEMRDFRRQTADAYLGQIKALAKNPKYAGLPPEKRTAFQSEIRQRFREEFGADLDWRRIRE
jgi:hypothetical protein